MHLQFDLERCEQRLMMAGDVQVRVAGGDLVVTGDNQGNELVIRSTASADTFALEGLNGTTINGQGSATFSGVDDDMRINLRSGDNRLVASNRVSPGVSHDFQIADDLTIRSASGQDVLILGQVSVGDDIRVRSSGGDDAIILARAHAGGDVRVSTGAGSDLFGTPVQTSGIVAVNSGGGGDIIAASFTEAELVINAGGGNDQLWVTDVSTSGDLTIKGGGGNDERIVLVPNPDGDVGGKVSESSIESRQEWSGFFQYVAALELAAESHPLHSAIDDLSGLI